MATTMESEKTPPSPTVDDVDVGAMEAQERKRTPAWMSKVTSFGVELRGITPVPDDERTDKRFWSIFFVWFTMSTNLLPIVTGMVGTFAFGLSLKECSLLILFFSLVCAMPPAYFCTFGARTGLRQMIHARYTFGFYLVSIIVALNLCTLAGFGIIGSVLGGSTLAAVSNGGIDSSAGIVIIALVAMFVNFGGYKFLHQYERYSWILSLIAIIITVGVGGKELKNQPDLPGSPAALIISFGGVVAGFLIPWAAMAADIAVYTHPSAGTARIFWYTWSGLVFPTVPLMVLGAAIGGATTANEAWSEMYTKFSVGGALQAMLLPAGGFGRFVAVLLAFSVIGNIAATMYAISLNFQIVIPYFVRVPRFIFSIVYTAICIPVAIQAAKEFFASLENFIYLIAYWSAAYCGVVAAEHFVFRKGNCSTYVVEYWNQAKKLPTGIAAIGAMALSMGLVVPCMSQVWFTGPLAATTGDIGFEVALVLAPLLYLPLRWIELKYRPL